MKRYRRDPSRKVSRERKDRYGPGILVFTSKRRKQDKNPAYAAFPTSVITRPLSCVARNTFRQLLSRQPDSRRHASGRNLPAPFSVYVLVLYIIPHVSDIGILFHQRRRLVGLHSRLSLSFALSLFLHQHADDPVLLPDIGQ